MVIVVVYWGKAAVTTGDSVWWHVLKSSELWTSKLNDIDASKVSYDVYYIIHCSAKENNFVKLHIQELYPANEDINYYFSWVPILLSKLWAKLYFLRCFKCLGLTLTTKYANHIVMLLISYKTFSKHNNTTIKKYKQCKY